MNRRNPDRCDCTTPYRKSLTRAATVFAAAGVALACGTTGPVAFAVEIMAAAQVLAETDLGLFNEIDSHTVPDPVSPVSASKQGGIGVLGGVAHATTGLGWIRLNAFSDSVVSPVYASGYLDTLAVGEFVDEITITPANPALLNQSGAATFAYHVDGFASRGEGGSGVQAGVNSPNPGLGTLFANNFYGDAFGTYIDDTRQFTQPVTFGQPFELRVFMFGRARVEVNGAFDLATFAEVDLGNALEWMGALEVVDQSQTEVIDYVMTSASGTDYRNAINAPIDPEPIPGDYNDNGVVDAADYVLWRKGGPLANEVDNPGTVNAADYTEWRARFGNPGSGSGSGATANAAVPEPASLVLLMCAAAGWFFRRRRATPSMLQQLINAVALSTIHTRGTPTGCWSQTCRNQSGTRFFRYPQSAL